MFTPLSTCRVSIYSDSLNSESVKLLKEILMG
jgi:hypothetical protein